MKNLIRFGAFAVYQILFLIAWLPLWLIGLFVIPVLTLIGIMKARGHKDYGVKFFLDSTNFSEKKEDELWPWKKFSDAYQHVYNGYPDAFYIWSNEGDGVLGPVEYKNKYPKWSVFRRAVTWSTNRNPVNNSRFVPPYNIVINPNRVMWISNVDLKGSVEAKVNWFDSKLNSFILFTYCQYPEVGNKFKRLYLESKAGLLVQYKSPYDRLVNIVNNVLGRPRRFVRTVKFQTGFKVYPKDVLGFTIPYRAKGAGNALAAWKFIN